ncbi:hypothetical protein BCR44DRAFT_1435311 [Catenaria anguillulae PL171]|uniref:polynucleotide adenylyltransferase n=1 Tax=Catenaria anguillulae PL171 TaxID=765915 RepID=A0A1Y2HJZ8_9FUNG|nr:hypothetical protein BCR44DRAFT_1435311 [Catenaria anguillulae PL171]
MDLDFIAFDFDDNDHVLVADHSSSPTPPNNPWEHRHDDDSGDRPKFSRRLASATSGGAHDLAAKIQAITSPSASSSPAADPLPADNSRNNGSSSAKRRRDDNGGTETNLLDDFVIAKLEDANVPVWSEGKDYSEDPSRRLHEEIVDFAAYMRSTPDETRLRETVLHAVESIVRSVWRTAEVHTFGSFVTGLYLPHSDLDVTVHTGQTQSDGKRCVYRLADAFRRLGTQEFCNLETIAFARVPIIKVVHTLSGFQIDISFNQSSGFVTAKYINDKLTQVPALRWFVLVLKMFLYSREANEVFNGGLSSYTVITMVLGFLESHPLVKERVIRPEENLGVLLLEMLELYGDLFEMRKVAITDQGFIPRSRVPMSSQDATRVPLVVVDPTNPANVLTVGSREAVPILHSFFSSFTLLARAMAICKAKKRAPKTLLGLILQYDARVDRRRQQQIELSREIYGYGEDEEQGGKSKGYGSGAKSRSLRAKVEQKMRGGKSGGGGKGGQQGRGPPAPAGKPHGGKYAQRK